MSHNIAIFPYEYRQFHMLLKNQENISGVKFKVVSLYGKCDLYFSTSNPSPNEDLHEGKISVDNKNISSIALKSYDLSLKFPTYQTTENVFIAIQAYEYTIIDIYSEEVLESEGINNLKIEILTPNKMVFRSIQEKDYFLNNQKVDIYYKNFQFVLPHLYEHIESFNVTINSNHLGLYICVQQGQVQFDFNRECDFTSSTENLEISNGAGKF